MCVDVSYCYYQSDGLNCNHRIYSHAMNPFWCMMCVCVGIPTFILCFIVSISVNSEAISLSMNFYLYIYLFFVLFTVHITSKTMHFHFSFAMIADRACAWECCRSIRNTFSCSKRYCSCRFPLIPSYLLSDTLLLIFNTICDIIFALAIKNNMIW